MNLSTTDTPLVDFRLYSTTCLAPPTFILNLHAGRVSLQSCVAQRGSCSGTRCEHSVKILSHLVLGHGARVRHSLGANVNTPFKYPTVEFRQSADVHDMVETLYSGTKLGVCTRYTLVVIQIQEFWRKRTGNK